MKILSVAMATTLMMIGWVAVCQEQGVVERTNLEQRDGLYYEVGSEKPFTGKSVKHFPSGHKAEAKFRDGKLHGKMIEWFENGQKGMETEFRDGKKCGEITIWYENGQMSMRAEFREDNLNGKMISWHENGQKMTEVEFIDGKLNGEIISCYENGQQQAKGEFLNGTPHGKWIYYYENGKKEKEVEYRDGKVIKAQCWDEEGESIPCPKTKEITLSVGDQKISVPFGK